MKVEMVKIEELNPAEYNPRLLSEKEYEQLKSSLVKFGFVDPIIVNENPDRKNIVIGGHQRLRIAKDLGYNEVPVTYLNLDEAGEMELNIRLNKNTGHWDYELLANHYDNGLLFEVGFTENELGLNVPVDDFNKSTLADGIDSYLEGTIKQIVFYFKGTDKKELNDFGSILERLDNVMAQTGAENHTNAFIKILEHYENTRAN